MREIKFRVFDKERRYMFDPGIVAINLYSNLIRIIGCLGDEMSIPVERVELMQFTGLKDKNGVEIFEGDIADDQFGKNQLFEVVWVEREARFGKRYLTKPPFSIPFPIFKFDEHIAQCKVIGNIHQNPEMLEQLT